MTLSTADVRTDVRRTSASSLPRREPYGCVTTTTVATALAHSAQIALAQLGRLDRAAGLSEADVCGRFARVRSADPRVRVRGRVA
jgi:hypothetical protein